jgi:phage-related protein
VTEVLSKLIKFAVEYLPKLLPMLMDAAVKLLQGAIKAITDNISKIAEMVTTLIKSFVKFITENLPAVIKVAVEIIIALAKGLVQAIPDLIKAVPEIISAIVSAFVNSMPDIIEIGANIVRGIFQGIANLGKWFWEQLKAWAKDKLGWLADLLGIKSPSTVMRDMIGKPMVQGMALGITENSGLIDKAMSGLVPSAVYSSVDMNINRRFNDVVNSTARGNPLAAEIIAGFRAALSEHNEQVIVLNDREFGRAVRKVAFA